MREYKGKLFNEHCHKCKYLKHNDNGMPYCFVYTKATEECCEVDGFSFFEERKKH